MIFFSNVDKLVIPINVSYELKLLQFDNSQTCI